MVEKITLYHQCKMRPWHQLAGDRDQRPAQMRDDVAVQPGTDVPSPEQKRPIGLAGAPPGAPPGPPPIPPPVRRPVADDTHAQGAAAPHIIPGGAAVELPRISARTSLTPELDKEIAALREQRRKAMRSYYLVTDKSGGSTSIPPYFALQSALMELNDAEIELDAARARAESVEEALTRMQEDAFSYTTASAAAES